MAVEAGRIGLSEDETWRLTPRELSRAFVIHAARSESEFNRDTTLAYQVVRIWLQTQHDKRMPKLDTLLAHSGPRPSQKQSVESMRFALKQLAQQYSGLKKGKGKKEKPRGRVR